jgi:hypothetical protein
MENTCYRWMPFKLTEYHLPIRSKCMGKIAHLQKKLYNLTSKTATINITKYSFNSRSLP